MPKYGGQGGGTAARRPSTDWEVLRPGVERPRSWLLCAKEVGVRRVAEVAL